MLFTLFAPPLVESTIAEYKGELAQLETAVNGVLGQIKDVEGTVDDYIKFLEEELARTELRDWEVAADNVKAKLALFSVEELQRVAAYQKIFVKNLDDLSASAQAYLDQGAEISSDDEPAHEIKSLHILLSRSQTEPGRTVKQEQEEISRNHIQRVNLISVCVPCHQ